MSPGGAGGAVSGVSPHPVQPLVAAVVGGLVVGMEAVEGGGQAVGEGQKVARSVNGVSFWGVASAWTGL